MLNVEKTIELYGYHPNTLKRFSEKPVVITCEYCGKDKPVRNSNYVTSPDTSCGSQSCRQKRREKTCLDRFGQRECATHPSVVTKRKENTLKIYGVTHTSKLESTKHKMSESQKEVSAVRDEKGNSLVVSKRKNTLEKTYGSSNLGEIQSVVAKRKATCISKYGSHYAISSEEVKKKIRESNIQKFGVPFPGQRKDVQEKIRNTNLARYGVESVFSLEEIQEKADKTRIEKFGKSHSINQKYGKSEKELREFLEGLTGKTFSPNRKILDGKELDMYNEELGLAVEFCGLRWHTEDSPNPRTRKYHYSKMQICEKHSVRLITIFEDEWLHRKAQVKNFLKSVLSVNSINLFARKCKVSEISKELGRAFFEEHHIQGKNNLGKHYAGLFHAGELVGAMSFGRHHRKPNVCVLDRLCFKENVTVVGGASKLFKFLLKLTGASSVVSWSDNRWSQGKVYKALGFIKDEELGPDYSYVSFSCSKGIRISKQSQKKSSTGCPKDKTEKQFALEHDLHRIWDCGHIRWKFVATQV